MDFELRAAKAKWEKEQKEKKERARKRLEQEKKARDEAARRQEAIETAQRIRRMEESAAALAVCSQSPRCNVLPFRYTLFFLHCAYAKMGFKVANRLDRVPCPLCLRVFGLGFVV
jgi:hypothetical protein